MSRPPSEDLPRTDQAVDSERLDSDPEIVGDDAGPETSEQETLAFYCGVAGHGSDETDSDIRIDQQIIEEQLAEKQAERLNAVLADVKLQLDVNQEEGSRPIYAGFEFVQTNEVPAAAEAPYVGAFLPLQVAKEFPELLVTRTISYDDVYTNDLLPRSTRVVVRPGVFRMLGRNRFVEIFGSMIAFGLYLAALVAGVAYLASRFLK